MLMEKDSVSRAPVWSCTWIVKTNRPSVVGVPVMPPEPTPWVNNLRPGGICPETTLNWTGFSDVRQPVVEKYHVLSVPTLPSGKVVGVIVQVELVGGGGEELTVQPDRRAVATVADPSLTSTVQSAGAVKPLLSILKRPEPSLVPMATPSTVMVRLGLAWPSMRSCVPLSSAREMLTAACAAEATTRAPIRTRAPTSARRAYEPESALRDVVAMVFSFPGRDPQLVVLQSVLRAVRANGSKQGRSLHLTLALRSRLHYSFAISFAEVSRSIRVLRSLLLACSFQATTRIRHLPDAPEHTRLLECLPVNPGRGIEPRLGEGGYPVGRGKPVVQPAAPHYLEGGCVYEAHHLEGYGCVGCGGDDGARGACIGHHPPHSRILRLRQRAGVCASPAQRSGRSARRLTWGSEPRGQANWSGQ